MLSLLSWFTVLLLLALAPTNVLSGTTESTLREFAGETVAFAPLLKGLANALAMLTLTC